PHRRGWWWLWVVVVVVSSSFFLFFRLVVFLFSGEPPRRFSPAALSCERAPSFPMRPPNPERPLRGRIPGEGRGPAMASRLVPASGCSPLPTAYCLLPTPTPLPHKEPMTTPTPCAG